MALPDKKSAANRSSINKIGPGTVIEGNITSLSDIRVDGKIIGNVITPRKIMLGEHSELNGNVQTHTMIVMGTFKGEMEIQDTLHLHKSARLSGKIKANKLIIEEGAEFNGECYTGGIKQEKKPTAIKKS